MCQFLLVLYYFFLVHVGPLQSPGWALQSPGLFQKSFLLFYLSVLLVFVHIFRTSVLQMLVSPLLSGILYKRSHFCSFVPCAWWYLLCVLQLMLLTALLIFLLLLRWYLLLGWFYLFCMLLLLLFQHLPPLFCYHLISYFIRIHVLFSLWDHYLSEKLVSCDFFQNIFFNCLLCTSIFSAQALCGLVSVYLSWIKMKKYYMSSVIRLSLIHSLFPSTFL